MKGLLIRRQGEMSYRGGKNASEKSGIRNDERQPEMARLAVQ